MNAEQLKQLKPDDEIFIRARYITTLNGGDVLFSHSITYDSSMTINMEDYTHHKNIILPSELQPAPKYDPCRLFKAGDEAKVSTVKGRHFSGLAEEFEGVTVVVTRDETTYSNIFVRCDEDEFTIDPAYLELVTPVEERSPYYVKENASVYEVFNRNENNSSVAIFFKSQYSIEKAKERAEAECARMNAEHRKEQNND